MPAENRIMAVDIGFRCTGYAIMEWLMHPPRGGRWHVVELGIKTTSKPTGTWGLAAGAMDSIALLVRNLDRTVAAHGINKMVVELPHGGAKSAQAMRAMAWASAALAALCELRDIAPQYLPPRAGKLAACGKADASKDEVVAAIAKKYGKSWPEGKMLRPHREAMADALAIFEAAKGGHLCQLAKKC